ncbi:MAG TPA: hypothetical protein VK619_10420 [Pyrinomonadaceae bacterium]|nr:hypothetical protein [Pyrinomonadaceae bacterium]
MLTRSSNIQKIIAAGRGKRRIAGTMNRTEAAYADILQRRKLSGELLDWWYEAVTFKLADDCRYTPDFMTVRAVTGQVEFHEIKGSFIRDDALVKLKVAAQMFPFVFYLCVKESKKSGGEWKIKVV